jgi:hypothetical protein
MAYSIYADHPYKVCKACGQELELAMFAKKSKYKYNSRCKACLSKRTFTPYYYPTADMQKIAVANNKRIYRYIYLYGTTAKICRGCNKNPVECRSAHCKECKRNARAAKERKYGFVKNKRKQKNDRLHLSDRYIRHLLKNSLKNVVENTTDIVIPPEIIQLKRQAIIIRRSIGARTKVPVTPEALAKL